MVAPPKALVALAAACWLLDSSSAAPITTDPTTPLGVVGALTAGHPAYGARMRANHVQPLIKFDPNAARAESLEILGGGAPATNSTEALRRHLRDLEAAETDVGRLESYYGEPMERNLDVLRNSFGKGATKAAPWPGSYWPTYQDGINAVWKSGEPSPAEKFARAFNRDVKQFMDQVSARSGILTQTGNRACTSDTQCSGLGDGSRCAIRAGQSSGYCIPTWYGLCHAWAPAAEVEPEPQCATKLNGVTFRPMDIKALLTQLYNDAYIEVVFLGARFDGPDSPLNLDRYGRFQDAARRDLGPGLFHIAVTNVLGKHKQGFVLDVTPGSEVWNQPVSSYQILESRVVDTATASQQYFRTRTYPFNADMKKLAYTRTRVSWILEAYEDGPLVSTGRVQAYTKTETFEYLLELDSQLNIIGGEWVGNSRQNHPDFFWFPQVGISPDTVTDLGMSYKDVRRILDASVACKPEVPGSTPAPTTEAPKPTPTPTPTTEAPKPTPTPTTEAPQPTPAPTTEAPKPTPVPTTAAPKPTPSPTTEAPKPTPTTQSPVTQAPKPTPSSSVPGKPPTSAPTTSPPVVQSPRPTSSTTTPRGNAPSPSPEGRGACE